MEITIKLLEESDLKNLYDFERDNKVFFENIGSQVVLVKNGFQFIRRLSQYIFINGKWQDSINFEKIIG